LVYIVDIIYFNFYKAVADIIRTTLGPRAMLKMLLDPMGGIVMTNDGNCILREVDVSHPAAKSMIELSRAQDEEVGDGTTSVIILSEFCMLSIHWKELNVYYLFRRRNIVRGRAIVGPKFPSHCNCEWLFESPPDRT
jgi:hypothetical protein